MNLNLLRNFDILKTMETQKFIQDSKINIFNMLQDLINDFRLIKTKGDSRIPRLVISEDNQVLNAYAFYGDNEDVIIITKKLFNYIFDIFFNKKCERNLKHSFLMSYIVLAFCIFHEFSHLYKGHNQICFGGKLALTYNIATGISYLGHQTLETICDWQAADMLTIVIKKLIKTNEFRHFYDYKNEDMFFADIIKAITGFYYILHSLENDVLYKEEMIHPPAFLRSNYVVREIIMENIESFRKRRKLFKNYVKYYFGDKSFFIKIMNTTKLYDKRIDMNFLSIFDDIIQRVFDKELKDKLEYMSRWID